MQKEIIVMFRVPERKYAMFPEPTLPQVYREVLAMLEEGCEVRGWKTPAVAILRTNTRTDGGAQMAWSIEVADASGGTVTLCFDAGSDVPLPHVGHHDPAAPPGAGKPGKPAAAVWMADEHGSVQHVRRLPIMSAVALVRALSDWPLDLMDRMAQEECERRQGGAR